MTERHLGKYQIIEEIGKGGFATVYRARDLDLDREVALKVLDPLLTRDPVWVARFRREARAVASLDHPRVVTVHEIGQAEGLLYIAMKLVEGGSLAQRLAGDGPLSWEETLRITGEISEVLDFAHSQGVLHRDLKPANVLLDERNGAVLTDFGFARLVADNTLSVSLGSGAVGTPAYIAPEVWEGEEATARTDIYALGCMVYEMVTGEVLFTGATPPAVMRAHFRPRSLPGQWPEGTPDGLHEVLETVLAQEPEQRFGSAGEFVGALARLSEDHLAAPYAELEAAVAGEEWQTALTLAGQIKAIDPEYRDVGTLEDATLLSLDQQARREQAFAWHLEAQHALDKGELKAAILAVYQWQELTPDDPETTVFLATIEHREKERLEATVQEEAKKNTGAAGRKTRLRLGRGQDRTKAPRSDAARKPTKTTRFSLRRTTRPATPLPKDDSAPPLSVESSVNGMVKPHHRRRRIVSCLAVVFAAAICVGAAAVAVVFVYDNVPLPTTRMDMVQVPAGNFTMGSPDGVGIHDEHPQHTVYLDRFYIDKTEVTVGQYRSCDIEGPCSSPRTSGSCTYGDIDKLNHPINCVSWHQAERYCAWMNKRLPTEAEWEKAALGTDAGIYPWGNNSPSCNKTQYGGCSGLTIPAGSLASGASPYGALDMVGNVWEWVADWYDDSYYAQSPGENPQGPGDGEYRVKRGGSYASSGDNIRAANRGNDHPDYRNSDIGFRCARSS